MCALISKGADANARDGHGKTPLMYAAKCRMLRVMEALVAMGADVEAADSRHGMRALHYALNCKQEAAAFVLLQQDPPCDVNASDIGGTTPLMEAPRSGMVEAMELLVAMGADVEAEDIVCGRRTLHHALEDKQEAAALFLIQQDPPCNVNASDMFGTTPLMYATWRGMVGVMEALVAMSADVEAADSKHGMRALHHALARKQEAAAFFLLQRDPPCDVNARDAHGGTPLMFAAIGGMVELLVAMGADVEAADENRTHALHHALDCKQEAAALFLIQQNPPCNVNAPDLHGMTLLMYAARSGIVGVMELLVAMSADVEAVDCACEKRALHHALNCEQEAAALFLLQQDPPCDVNARDAHGSTPLMYAANSGMVGAIEALVAMGADVEAADSEHGMRALHYALDCEQEAAALFLLQRDPPCNVNASNIHGMTPLMHAAGRGMVSEPTNPKQELLLFCMDKWRSKRRERQRGQAVVCLWVTHAWIAVIQADDFHYLHFPTQDVGDEQKPKKNKISLAKAS